MLFVVFAVACILLVVATASVVGSLVGVDMSVVVGSIFDDGVADCEVVCALPENKQT